MGQEKRRFARFTLNVPTSLTLYQVETFHACAIANISMGGCFLPFQEELPTGEKCQLTISLGEGLKVETMVISGEIVRSDSEGVGIKFTEKSDECRSQLEKIITYYESK